MKLEFAVASTSQRDKIESILRSAFTPYARKAGYELASDAYEWLAPALRAGRVYAGSRGEEVLGVVVTDRRSNELVIDYIAIDPDRQGAGIGSWLVRSLEDTARRDGVEALVLHTAEIMDDLLQFYHRHGFVETGRALPVHGMDTNLRVHLRKVI